LIPTKRRLSAGIPSRRRDPRDTSDTASAIRSRQRVDFARLKRRRVRWAYNESYNRTARRGRAAPRGSLAGSRGRRQGIMLGAGKNAPTGKSGAP
jgi:hypothetical protein